MQGLDLLQEGEFLLKDCLVVFPDNGRITGFLINILNIWGYHNYVCQLGVIKIIFLSCPSLSCSEPVLIGRKEGKHNKTPCSALLRMHSQQTFVLMKNLWRCRSSSSSEEVLIKTNNRLTHTSSEVVLIKVNIFYIYVLYVFRVAKTSSRCLEDIFARCTAKVSSRRMIKLNCSC